ncbi:MAG: hypothetical protein C4547_13115 [Phycisphaerales bacterium]|nr:MAG: hypothetical protein C4547_13115 [Phycisphaerales bacterium]
MTTWTKAVLCTVGAVGLTALLAGAVMNPTDERVAWEDLPQAVRDTILREANGATVREIEKEMRGGQVVYEAEWLVNGREVEIAVAADGTLLAGDDDGDDDDGDDDDGDDGDEAEVPEDQVPEAARAVLRKQAGNGAVLHYSREVERGVVIYEAEWQANGVSHEAAVTAEGALLEVEQIIPAAGAPAGVRSAIDGQFGAGAAVVVEKKMIVLYEIEGKINGRNREILVTPTGRVISGGDDDDGDDDDGDDDD